MAYYEFPHTRNYYNGELSYLIKLVTQLQDKVNDLEKRIAELENKEV